MERINTDSCPFAFPNRSASFNEVSGNSFELSKKESVDFTDTYAKTTQVIIVKEGSDKVKNADDLETASIGVQLGTTGHIFVQDFDKATIKPFSKGAEAVEALSSGKVDAVVIDSEPAKEFVKAKSGLTILSDPFAEEEYAICLKKGSELTGKFNDALKELKADGTLDSIVKKYIQYVTHFLKSVQIVFFLSVQL